MADYQGGNRNRGQGGGANLDTSRIQFADIDAELFNEVANATAKSIAECRDRNANKSTQIRKFYDELCMWEERVRLNPGKFSENLPFIKMINAKAAYANGRKLVDDNFSALIEHCVKQVNTPQDLKTFKTFFEAFLGFLKRYRA
jgi:CRISPR-associated protein Csm2